MEIYPLDILIHIINIVFLFIILKLLIFKPVKKFLDERKARIEREKQELIAAQAETEQLKAEYEKKLALASEEANALAEEKKRQAKEEAGFILDSAKMEAEEIKKAARKEAQEEKEKVKESLQKELTSTAIEIAETILKKEVSLETNKVAVEEFARNR